MNLQEQIKEHDLKLIIKANDVTDYLDFEIKDTK